MSMPEPTSTTASAFVAAASAFTLTLLGVEYHALVWALAGSLAALAMAPAQQQQATPRTRLRAVAFVVFSTLAGAAISGGLVVLLPGIAAGGLLAAP